MTVVDAPTLVTLTGGGTVREGDSNVTADVNVALGRALGAGEVVDVPIRLLSTTQARLGGPSRFRPLRWTLVNSPGAGIAADPVGLRPGPYGANLVVRFTGSGARTATIRFAATAVDNDTTDETVNVTIGSGLNSPSRATKFTGGLTAHATNNKAVVTIEDDDAAAVLSEAVFGSASFTATEAAASRTVTVPVTLTPAPTAAVTVNYSVGGTATSGDDYTALSGTVSVGTSGTANISVVVVDDDVHDGPAETVVLTITDDAAYSVGTVSVSTVTITDDEMLPEVSLVLTPGEVSESGDPVVVTATLDHASDEAIELVVEEDSDGAAVTLSDNKTLTIAAGATVSTGTVTLTPNDDDIDTADRAVDVTASASGGNDIEGPEGEFLFVLDDDDTTVTLSRAAGTSVAEGSTHAYTISLSRPLVSGETLTAPLTLAGTATRGTDYTLAGTPATGVAYHVLNTAGLTPLVDFIGGPETSTVATITLTAVADDDDEAGGETVDIGLGTLILLRLTATSVDNAASLTIADGTGSGADAVFDAVPEDLAIVENADGSTTAVRVGSPVTATDSDGDPVSYSLEAWRPRAWPSGAEAPDVPAGFVIDASSGQISYTGTGLDREALRDPVSMAVGSVSMSVVASSLGADGTATAVRQTVTVTVTDVGRGRRDGVGRRGGLGAGGSVAVRGFGGRS